MSQPILVVIIIVALAGAAYLLFLHRRTSTLSAKVAAMPNALGAALADLKAHVTKEAEAVKQRTATVGTVIVDKLGGDKTTKPIPVVGTTAEPAPAAPAPTEAVVPPPATVAPAASPAAPAPSAGGSGTASSQLASSYPGKHDLLVAAAAIKTPYAIAVDGMQVWPGFGPPDEYFSRPDGSVSKVRAPAVMMPAGSLDAMAASYPNVAALLSAIAAAHFTGAVEVDGKVVHAGFGKHDGSPWAYITQPDGTIKAA